MGRCGLIQELCGQFRVLVLSEEEEMLCSRLKGMALEARLEALTGSLHRLCYMIQCLGVDDMPELVEQLAAKFQSQAMTVSLTENKLNAVDQLFSSLSLNSFQQTVEQMTGAMAQLDMTTKASQVDLDTVCGLLRYILTTDELDTVTVMSYFQRLYIL